MDAHAPASLRGTRDGRFGGLWGGRTLQDAPADQLAWLNACRAEGYTAPTWPPEYGGAGLSREQARVFEQELEAAELPPPVVGFGLTMIGPTLLDYGNDEQKARHLPPIARGEIRWCQGYSEPGAGSDVGGLGCRGDIDADHVVVNGPKVCTSHADKSDWIFALVRTTPRSAEVNKRIGISFVLIDMATPGVTARPIMLISGTSPFCETTFDNVRVPLTNVVGALDHGWGIAKALLGYERTMVGTAMSGDLVGMERSLLELAADKGKLTASRRLEIAACSIRGQAVLATIDAVSRAMKAGRAPGPEASVLKLCGSQLKQRRWELAAELDGGTDPTIREKWLRSRGNTIEGGTSEIQLNIIAQRVLGLPNRDAARRPGHADEEIAALAEMARRFAAERSPVSRNRAYERGGPAAVQGDGVWEQVRELGFLDVDALGLSATTAVLYEAGRTLMPDAFIATLRAEHGDIAATIGASALLLGAADAAFEMTIEYLRTREQFDVRIGSFQALQHRAAAMFCDLALCRSLLDAAATAPNDARLAHAARYLVGVTARKVANEAVQMHGGIGVTDEHDIGLYLKQIFYWDVETGGSHHHLDAYAAAAAGSHCWPSTSAP